MISVGILCSGGDSQGMNAAVRALTRFALQTGTLQPYGILNGFYGLVNGAEMIIKLDADSVRGLLPRGGTVLASARCMEFMTKEGRRNAVLNMLKVKMGALVVIGGDGSLTGADILRQEFNHHAKDLLSRGEITQDTYEKYGQRLVLCGLVGSIDNDMALTDETIGGNSALNRICEAIDSIFTTAQSHSRSFIVEVMGRRAGWLALNSAIATNADYVFLPEYPPPFNPNRYNTWQEELLDMLRLHKSRGQLSSLIIVAEGAIDRDGNSLHAEDIRNVIASENGIDARCTILGHIQRGGITSPNDRWLATVQSFEAIKQLLNQLSSPSIYKEPTMIGIVNGIITAIPLRLAVQKTGEIGGYMKRGEWQKVGPGRDPEYQRNYQWWQQAMVRELSPLPVTKPLRIAILHAGHATAGMNQATLYLFRTCLLHSHVPLAVYDGWHGLAQGRIVEIDWKDLARDAVRTGMAHQAAQGVGFGMGSLNGSALGCSKDHPRPRKELGGDSKRDVVLGAKEDPAKIYQELQKAKIDALVVIGGYEGYAGMIAMKEYCQAKNLTMTGLIIPASITNNLPGTEVSLGIDTALTTISDACDRLRLFADANRRRVFLVETKSDHYGFLPATSALITGSSAAYIAGFTPTSQLSQDAKRLQKRYARESSTNHPHAGRILIVGEDEDTDLWKMARSLEKEAGKPPAFDVRTVNLGALQSGGHMSSPLDRVRGASWGTAGVSILEQLVQEGGMQLHALGSFSGSSPDLRITSLEKVEGEIDWKTHGVVAKKRLGLTQCNWHMNLELMRLLSNQGQWPGNDSVQSKL